MRSAPRLLLAVALAATAQCSRLPPGGVPPVPRAASALKLPLKEGTLRFAVIGDSGTGARRQYEVGQTMADFRELFPFELVIMLGDNIYGSDTPEDYKRKFELPYKPLLDAGVKFYACLGNHDDTNQRFYKPFNMEGQRFYSFKPKGGIRFFALDSNYIDKEQLDWLERELKGSESEWKIAFFHHPLYSSGEFHGPSKDKRKVLEPIFRKYGVDVVFSGHEHFYERIRPQHGIYYFISGGAGQLRYGGMRMTAIRAKGFATDFHFMLLEADRQDLYFQTVSRTGVSVDWGVIHRPEEKAAEPSPSPSP
jgi:predicted phosphodiesterase